MSFGAETTTEEVLEGRDLNGTTMIVTGASAGIGVETARALAEHGASLVLGVRDVAKAEANLSAAGVDLAAHDLLPLDLADLASVRRFTDEVIRNHPRLDVVIANAGVMATPEGRTADGFETQFGVNHLANFVLVNRLVPLLVSSAPARVVIVSSSAHRRAQFELDDPNFEQSPYDPWYAYSRSKSAAILYAVDLDRRLRDRGVRAIAVHPGGILTELGRHVNADTMALMAEHSAAGRSPASQPMKTIEAGAATSVWAAVVADVDEVGGTYCEDCGPTQVTDDLSQATGVAPHAIDPVAAAKVWALSEELVDEPFAV